nr:MAG TPA: hypothetical protein [Caudoviricetes sp.]DAR67126.1 MAG TPA: hypothetical protein [Caudoviricetes sp.]
MTEPARSHKPRSFRFALGRMRAVSKRSKIQALHAIRTKTLHQGGDAGSF